MTEAMKVPFFRVNVLSGVKGAKVVEDPKACADVVKKAERPFLVIGARAIEHFIGKGSGRTFSHKGTYVLTPY